MYVNVSTSWFNRYINKALLALFFDWLNAYQNRFYERVGVVDMVTLNKSIYVWDSAAKDYKPKSDNFIYVLKRKDR